jgi:hypothetical protein
MRYMFRPKRAIIRHRIKGSTSLYFYTYPDDGPFGPKHVVIVNRILFYNKYSCV